MSMVGNAEALAQGRRLLQTGQAQQAAPIFAELVKASPWDIQLWHDLGVAYLLCGQNAQAEAPFRKVLEMQPNYVSALNNLGYTLNALNRQAEAVPFLRHALKHQPDFIDALNNLGVSLSDLAQYDEAVATFNQALFTKPDSVPVLTNLGLALCRQGKPGEAVPWLQHALELSPNDPVVYRQLGKALGDQGKWSEAEAYYRQALSLQPNSAMTLGHLGQALLRLGKLDESYAYLQNSLRLKPDSLETIHNFGICLAEQGKVDEAMEQFQRCLQMKPDYFFGHTSMGKAKLKFGKLDEALAHFNHALTLNPEHAETRCARAIIYLAWGDFERGWPEYDWRLKIKELFPRPLDRCRWDGSRLDGKSILLVVEQGLGDVLQFIRYIPLIKELGGRVLFECHKALAKLLANYPGIDQMVFLETPPPPFDVQAPLLSLPAILNTRMETIPCDVPYVFADPKLIEHWKKELDAMSGEMSCERERPGPFRIGLAWQGEPKNSEDRRRSFPLRLLEPLAKIPGVQLFSLQKGFGADQVKTCGFPVVDFGAKLDETSGPFMDTAAIMKNLDLVITADTATGHLAGCLGVPVWIALSFAPDWRWLRDRSDSPWYPTVRLFRQNRPGDWADLFQRMGAALREKLALPPVPRESTPPPVSAAAPPPPMILMPPAPSLAAKSITIEINPGELLDRISILEIKTVKIKDAAKLTSIRTELAELAAARQRSLPQSPDVDCLMAELKTVNETLWQVEEDLRALEKKSDFGPEFIEFARSVYRNNDQRSVLKRRINELLKARWFEEKSYV